MGSLDKNQRIHPTGLLAQEQTIAAASANADAHSTHNHRRGVTVFDLSWWNTEFWTLQAKDTTVNLANKFLLTK